MSVAAFELPAAKDAGMTAQTRRRPLAFEKHRALGTPTSERLERITRLARRVCDVPLATIELTGGSPVRTAAAGDREGTERLTFQKAIELRVGGRAVGEFRI